MQQSEATPRSSKPSIGLLKDHLELASLEWGFEKQEAWRRLIILGVGAIFLTASFLYLQAALFGWFLRMGIKWEGIGLILGIFNFVLGMSAIFIFGKRHKDLGLPFEGTLSELKRSFSWIEQHFL